MNPTEKLIEALRATNTRLEQAVGDTYTAVIISNDILILELEHLNKHNRPLPPTPRPI